ncbi:MAG TPA: hypothetical protein VJT72_10485 [Pseudonocardiaceae bacterium]|nr:hypothetical protein [Pseudonocardiaceae bacterium]
MSCYYTYYSGLPMDGRLEDYIHPHCGFAAWPTNDGLTLVIGGWPFAELVANKKDIEGNYLSMFELAPSFAERIRAARRETRFVGAAVPNFFRKPCSSSCSERRTATPKRWTLSRASPPA